MAERAKQAGRPISRSMISAYSRGEVATPPGEQRILALAAALGCTYGEVAAAVVETFGLESSPSPERRTSQRAEAWVRLTAHRTEAEVEELLLIVEQVLRMRDMERPNVVNSLDDDEP